MAREEVESPLILTTVHLRKMSPGVPGSKVDDDPGRQPVMTRSKMFFYKTLDIGRRSSPRSTLPSLT